MIKSISALSLFRRARPGFTIIELLITLVVITILVTLSVIATNSYLEHSRDQKRQGQVTNIIAALEKYYDANGEYPACSDLKSADGSSAQNILGLKPVETTFPKGGSFVCLADSANLEQEDALLYFTGTDPSTGGMVFTVTYWSESEKEFIHTESKKRF